ncbi:MAG: DNA topoisomerase IB [Tepidiformaceae bacterium]
MANESAANGTAVSAEAEAQAAGLRYVNDSAPGIRRLKARGGFRYAEPAGEPVRDDATLARVRSLAIPPAWTDVWICARANGHIQATGRDARGRKQYRYHPRWRSTRDETKYGRMAAFGEALPAIRERVVRDAALAGLPREKVVATVVRLLEATLIRVGNEEYRVANGSFGLTTMRDRHVAVDGSEVRFAFRGKSGKEHAVSLRDRRLASIVRRCRDIPGYELFQYIDTDGARQSVGSADVNAYLKETTGQDFTAKDFRTWAGTVLASLALQEFEAFDSEVQAKRNVVRAIESVAERLGNTPTICRKSYVHPAVIDAYLEGITLSALRQRAEDELTTSLATLLPEEAAVLALLNARLARESARDEGRDRRVPENESGRATSRGRAGRAAAKTG